MTHHVTPAALRALKHQAARAATPPHNCAQTERDCCELHKALAESLRRRSRLQWELGLLMLPEEVRARLDPYLASDDLLHVLERTARES